MYLEENRISPLPTRVVFVWAVVLTAMVIYAFAWFLNLHWLWQVIDALTSGYNYGEPATTTINTIKILIVYNPIIALFGWILYGFVNSTRKDVRSYESYE